MLNGECPFESASSVEFGFDPNFTFLLFYNFFAMRQSNSGSFIFIAVVIGTRVNIVFRKLGMLFSYSAGIIPKYFGLINKGKWCKMECYFSIIVSGDANFVPKKGEDVFSFIFNVSCLLCTGLIQKGEELMNYIPKSRLKVSFTAILSLNSSR